jgi:hypothetical protein
MNQLDTALECEYIDEIYFNKMIEKIKRAVQVINGYVKYFKKRKEGV